MSEKIDFSGVSIFQPLTKSQCEALEKVAEVVTCDADCRLFSTGEEAKDVYVLLEGKVNIQVQLSSRPEKVGVVMLSQKGQVIGWSGLLGQSHYTASAICHGTTKMVKIPGQAFMEILEQDKEAGFAVLSQIITVVSGRLRNLQSVVLKTM